MSRYEEVELWIKTHEKLVVEQDKHQEMINMTGLTRDTIHLLARKP